MFQEGQTGIYIHWPFCLSKCPYCDFNIYLRQEHNPLDWRAAYMRAIEAHQALMPKAEIVSIYFGGGTPSLMAVDDIEAIISSVYKGWRVAKYVEITLEANPTSTETDTFKAFKAAGVNRLSLGVQSLSDAALKFLGRLHSAQEVRRAIDIAGDIFDRFTFDLIYALPDQSLSDWEHELRAAIPLMRGHLSAYQLTIKEGTAFEKQLQRGNLHPHDEDSIAAFFNLTYDMMAAAGMPAYEISNFGASGHESRHNQIYWHYNDYIGIGAGAHGRISYDGQKFATEDYKRPAEWMEAVGQRGHGAKPHTLIPPQERLTEALMGALRMKKRFDLHALLARCGLPPQDWERYISKDRLDVLSEQGWLTYDHDQTSITPNREGWLQTDSILPFILK